ncbi:MAG: hypothetical protein SFY66_08550 [Oculatellaceae cyanobacterium bins.114]|nr:hypothetical protein [Oculatellaceae cyanobacterium bins.114]
MSLIWFQLKMGFSLLDMNPTGLPQHMIPTTNVKGAEAPPPHPSNLD